MGQAPIFQTGDLVGELAWLRFSTSNCVESTPSVAVAALVPAEFTDQKPSLPITSMATDNDRCPHCGVQPGDYHRTGCDIEQCPYCGGQLVSCDCGRMPPLDDRMPWAGVWPGVTECWEFGWYARLMPGEGWMSCQADEPGAAEDLNRLHAEAVWDRADKRFVRRREPP
jgi:hypothetical protein